MQEINFKVFENNLRLIDFQSNCAKDELLDFQNHGNIAVTFIIPFQKELENNLLCSESKESKIALIRYYLSKLCVIQQWYEPMHDMLFSFAIWKDSETSYLWVNDEGVT